MCSDSHAQTATPKYTVKDVRSFTTSPLLVAQSRTHFSQYSHPKSRPLVAHARSRVGPWGPLGNVVQQPRPRRKAFWGWWFAESKEKLGSSCKSLQLDVLLVVLRGPARLSPRPSPFRWGFWETTSRFSGSWAGFQIPYGEVSWARLR